MIKSYIYKNLKERDAINSGYFQPKEDWKRLSEDNFINNISNININKKTLVAYYPGAFGCFHKGHFDVVKRLYNQLKEKSNNFIIVISPSNSDYTIEKYGNTNFASNYDRYHKILELNKELSKLNVVIDLNPMLNHRVDHNFTDLLLDFLKNNSIDKLNNHIIVGGKDRDYTELNNHSKFIKTIFFKEKVECSTSKDFVPKEIENKKLLLRVHSKEELDIFKKYMNKYYLSINPIYIKEELKKVEELTKKDNKLITICKDYKDNLNYIKISRKFINPLHCIEHDKNLKNKFKEYKNYTVIDSDIFSGTTKKFIESCGLEFKALIDLSHKKDYELLDIDDIKDYKFNYPWVDLSYRCSLPPFSREMHDKIKILKDELNKIGK